MKVWWPNLIDNVAFANRSKAIQKAIVEIIEKFDKNRLARECAKLDTSYEQVLTDEGLSKDMEAWPEY